jgi:hypothetical protein
METFQWVTANPNKKFSTLETLFGLPPPLPVHYSRCAAVESSDHEEFTTSCGFRLEIVRSFNISETGFIRQLGPQEQHFTSPVAHFPLGRRPVWMTGTSPVMTRRGHEGAYANVGADDRPSRS